jgi:hypothetical protein
MKIFGGEITEAQIAAGVAAMKGEFPGTKVMSALRTAGVTNVVSAAEVLINRELKTGRISRVTRGLYRENSSWTSN